MRKKSKNRTTSPLYSLLIGCAVACGMFVLSSLLFSFVTYLLRDPTAMIPWLSLPSFVCSGVCCALFLYSPKKGNLRLSLLSVALFLLLLLLLGVLLCHGAVSAQLFLYDAVYLLAFFAGCALRSFGTGGKRRRRF